MEAIRIDYTDIILDEVSEKAGKIIISEDSYGYQFHHYWGSMGMPLKQFLQKIGEDYFCRKLAPHAKGEINIKKTFANFRKALYECMNVAWWQHMEFQKELRYSIREIQSECHDERSFIELVQGLPDRLFFSDIEDQFERADIETAINDICYSEPWNYVRTYEAREHIFLCRLLPKLKQRLAEQGELVAA